MSFTCHFQAEQMLCTLPAFTAVIFSSFAIFECLQVWRPLKGPVQDSPLGVCDAATVSQSDLLTTKLIFPERTGEVYNCLYSPQHRYVQLCDIQSTLVPGVVLQEHVLQAGNARTLQATCINRYVSTMTPCLMG